MKSRYFEVNAAGCNIRCKQYFESAGPFSEAILTVHGFAGHKDNKTTERLAERIVSKHPKTVVVSFDLPAHGSDVRRVLSLHDCDTYLTLLLEDLRSRFGVDRPCVIANSFGGWLVMRYLADHGSPFRRIVLRSPAITMFRDVSGNILNEAEREQLARGKDVSVGFDRKVNINQAFLDGLREGDITQLEFLDYADDILIIHGTADEIADYESTRQFAEDNVIELAAVEGADHRFHDPKKFDTVIHATMDFLFE